MSPNKAWERQIVESVIRTGLLPQGEIRELECPDFTLVTPEGEIGIELTEYNSSEKERENTERFNRHIVPKITKRLRKVGGSDYDYLWGMICPVHDPTTGKYSFPPPQKEHNFIEELVDVIVKNKILRNARISSNDKEVEIYDFAKYPCLQSFLHAITCSWRRWTPVVVTGEIRWTCQPFVARFVGLSSQKLQEILDLKKKRVGEYRKNSFKKIILVIHSGRHLVSEFGEFSQYEISQLQEACKKVLANSGFDMVITYDYVFRQGNILYNSAHPQNTVCQ